MGKFATLLVSLILLFLCMFYFFPSLKNTYKSLPGDFKSSTLPDSKVFSSWKEFVPQSRLFLVKLPSDPQYAKDLVAIPNSDQKRRFDMYASEKIDGTLFLVSIITYPDEADTSFTSDILRQTVEELMRNKPDNKLTKIQDNVFQLHPTLDFSFDSQQFHVEGKVIMVNKRVFVLSYVTRKNEFDPAEYQYFIDSFKLLDGHPLTKEIYENKQSP